LIEYEEGKGGNRKALYLRKIKWCQRNTRVPCDIYRELGREGSGKKKRCAPLNGTWRRQRPTGTETGEKKRSKPSFTA